MLKEFTKFLTQSNALALAIGVIIGAATGKVVSALVDDLLMPVIGLALPAGDWREARVVLKSATDATGKVTESAIQYGHLLGTIIDFLLIALVVFLITKALLKPPPETKACPHCLELIPKDAQKCRACTSALWGPEIPQGDGCPSRSCRAMACSSAWSCARPASRRAIACLT